MRRLLLLFLFIVCAASFQKVLGQGWVYKFTVDLSVADCYFEDINSLSCNGIAGIPSTSTPSAGSITVGGTSTDATGNFTFSINGTAFCPPTSSENPGTTNTYTPSRTLTLPLGTSCSSGYEWPATVPSGSSSMSIWYDFHPRVTVSEEVGVKCRITVKASGSCSGGYTWQVADNPSFTSPVTLPYSDALLSLSPETLKSVTGFAGSAYSVTRYFRATAIAGTTSTIIPVTTSPPPLTLNSNSSLGMDPTCIGGEGKLKIVQSAYSGPTMSQADFTIISLTKKEDPDEACSITRPPEVPESDVPSEYCYRSKHNYSGTAPNPTTETQVVLEGDDLLPAGALTKGLYIVKLEGKTSDNIFTCITQDTLIITDPPKVSVSADAGTTANPNPGSPQCLGSSDAETDFTIANGIGNFHWDLYSASDVLLRSSTSASSSRNITVTGLESGQHKLRVRDVACNIASDPHSFIVPDGTTLSVSNTSIASPRCYKDHGVGTSGKEWDGSFKATATPNMSGESYVFTLYNSAGEISLETYQKSQTANAIDFKYLPAGGYYVKVEANGCTGYSTPYPSPIAYTTLTAPGALSMSVRAVDIRCSNGVDGHIRLHNIDKPNGDYDFTYSFNNESQPAIAVSANRITSASYTIPDNLPAGTYVGSINDNCAPASASNPIVINGLNKITIERPAPISITPEADIPIPCFDDQTSTLINLTNGTGPFDITVRKNSTNTLVANLPNHAAASFDVTDLGRDTYTVNVTDDCSVAALPITFAVTNPATETVSAIITKLRYDNDGDGANDDYHLTCPERNDGRITIKVKGGIRGKTKGEPVDYLIELKDALGGFLLDNVSSNNNANGSISAGVASGAYIEYELTNLAENIAYQITVSDYNTLKCVKSFVDDQIDPNLSLSSPAPLSIGALNINTSFTGLKIFGGALYVTCKGDQSGAVRTTVSGGNPRYVVKLFRRDFSSSSWPSEPLQQQPNVPAGPVEFAGLGFGDYKIEVVDLKSCQYMVRTFQINEAGSRLQIDEITPRVYAHNAHTSCYGYSDGEITLKASGGVGDYTYKLRNDDGYDSLLSKPGPEQIFRELPAINALGDTLLYVVSLRDAIGCTWKWENNVDSTMVLSPPDTVEFDWKIASRIVPEFEIPCHGDEARIYVWSEGGKYPHDVTIGGKTEIINIQSDTVEFNLTVGSYPIVFEDQLDCPAPVQVIELDEPDSHVQVVLDTLIPPVCIGGSDGEIHVEAIDGEPFSTPGMEYSFLIKEELASTFDTDTLKGLDVTFLRPASFYNPQNYTLRAVDRFDCSSDVVITLQPNPAPLTISFDTIASPSCYGGTDGFITVRASNYELIGGTSLTFKLSGGHFLDNGSDSIAEVTVTSDIYTFLNLQGTDLNGRIPYRAWIVDANACADTAYQYNDVLRLPSYEPVGVDLIKMIRPSCYNGEDGSLYLQVSGGVPPYTYSRNDVTFTGVGPDHRIFEKDLRMGDFGFSIRDAQYKADQPACQIFDTLAVAPGRFIRLVAEKEDVSCKGSTDGSIILRTFIDNRPVNEQYDSSLVDVFWTHANVSSLPIAYDTAIHSLGAGTFTAHVSYDVDSLICTTEKSVVILEPAFDFRILDVVTYEASCGTFHDGKAVVSIGGGWPDSLKYFRIDDDGPWTLFNGSSFIITGLAPGTHSVEVAQSSMLCKDVRSFEITSETLELTITQILPPSCPMAGDGAVVLNSPGNTALFAFENGAFQSLNVFQDLSEGTYRFVARKNGDASCFSNVVEAIVEDPEDCGNGPLTLSELTRMPATCPASSDGQALVHAAGGVPPYRFFWDHSGVEGNDLVTNLAPGDHTVTVMDAVGESESLNVVIETLSPLSVEVFTSFASCETTCDGSISVLPSGGSGGYLIQWDDNESTAFDVQNLCYGEYGFTLVDVLNASCSISRIERLDHYPNISIQEVDVRAPVCPGGTDGYIEVNVSGGSQNYALLWNVGAETGRLEGQLPGEYTLTVTDRVLGCQTQGSFLLPDTDPTQVNAIHITAPLCFGGEDGMAILELADVKSHLIVWDIGQIGPRATRLGAGDYSYTITNSSGCRLDGTVQIPDPLPLLSENIATPVACFNTCDGTIVLRPSGGTAPYFVEWAHGPRSISLQKLCAGSYGFEITDNHNCEIRNTVEVFSPMKLVLETQTTDPLCNGSEDGLASVTVSGGVEPYSYEWSNGALEAELVSVREGSYEVTVTDANNCLATTLVELNDPDPLLISETSIAPPSCTAVADGKISFVTVGGTGPYAFSWDHGSTDEKLTGLPAGEYTVNVLDDHGCSFARTFALREPASLEIVNLVVEDPHCHGDANGSVALNVVGGAKPYTLQWSNGKFDTNISGLSAGSYTVTIVDNKKCTLAETLVLNEPELPVIEGIPSSILICSGGIASAEPDGEWLDYEWKGPGNFTQVSKRFESREEGNYVLIAHDNRNCPAIVEFEVDVSPNALVADFLMISEAVAFEPIIFIDISQPVPSHAQWITPASSDVSVTKESPALIEVIFTAAGSYEIGMKASLDNCTSELYKTVIVSEPDPDGGNTGGRVSGTAEPGLEITLYPNPARDVVQIRIQSPVRDVIDLRLITSLDNRTIKDEKVEGFLDYLIEWDINQAKAGVYYLMYEQNGEIGSKRIVVIK